MKERFRNKLMLMEIFIVFTCIWYAAGKYESNFEVSMKEFLTITFMLGGMYVLRFIESEKKIQHLKTYISKIRGR